MRAVTSFNEYVHAAGADLNYDDNGNLMNDENDLHYHWDGLNRLRRVTDAAESTVATYVYDTDGRRLMKDLPGTTSDTLFAYDGWQVIVEYDAAGTPRRKYAYGAFINEPVFLDVAMEIALARRIEFQCVLPMPRQSGGKPPHSKAVFSAKPASHKRKRKGYSGLYSNEMKIK